MDLALLIPVCPALLICPEVSVLHLFVSQSKFRAHCMQNTQVKHQRKLEMPDTITRAVFPLVLFGLFQVTYPEH